MNNGTSPVFVMVFAGNCGACTNFKANQLKNLRAALAEPIDAQGTKVFPIEINIAKIGDKLPAKVTLEDGRQVDIPNELNKYAKFYPSFFLISAKDWQNGNINLNS